MSDANRITFAIGDIHGCLEKLQTVIAACRHYAAGRPTKFVMLGDYIDRGPDSRAVIEYLRNWHGDEELVCLMGNHEDMLLASLENSQQDAAVWLKNGGQNTLWSYNAVYPHQIPYKDTEWMKGLPFCHDDGLRFFVHAGVDPTIPLSEQTEGDMLYSRKTYPDDLDPGRYIVHGHTPQAIELPIVHPHRINLDTAACFDGPLSAAAFTSAQRPPVALIADDRIVELDAPTDLALPSRHPKHPL